VNKAEGGTSRRSTHPRATGPSFTLAAWARLTALGGSVSYYQPDAHEIDAIVSLPDRRWAGIEIKLGGQPAIDEGAKTLAAAASSIDQAKARPPAFLAVVAVGEYAYRRPDGVHVLPLALLGP